ncbi:hypothetical protein J2Y64_003193 [Aeromonas salmonicida]|nr:hypothetical protein [Aeromonas salmonicida]
MGLLFALSPVATGTCFGRRATNVRGLHTDVVSTREPGPMASSHSTSCRPCKEEA